MASDVKRESEPRGSGQARTRLARRAVVDAARALFVERGFAGTTVEAVSQRSEVPPATVYRLFGSKVGILRALLDVSIAGDDRPVAVADRPEVGGLLEEPDPQRMLAGFAAVTTAINERTSEVYAVLVGAAASDPAAAELLDDVDRQRGRGQQAFTRTLARRRQLRRGMKERDAADLVHALMAPEIYRRLVGGRGWAPARYRDWLTATLVQQLLADPP